MLSSNTILLYHSRQTFESLFSSFSFKPIIQTPDLYKSNNPSYESLTVEDVIFWSTSKTFITNQPFLNTFGISLAAILLIIGWESTFVSLTYCNGRSIYRQKKLAILAWKTNGFTRVNPVTCHGEHQQTFHILVLSPMACLKWDIMEEMLWISSLSMLAKGTHLPAQS